MKKLISISAVLFSAFLIAVVYAGQVSDSEEGLVAIWHFNEGIGDVTDDSVGVHYAPVDGAEWTTGQFGDALQFDGSDSLNVGCGFDGITHLVTFSLEAWIKIDENGWWPSVIEKHAGPWTYGGHPACPEGGWQYGWGLYPNIRYGAQLFVTSHRDAWWPWARADVSIPLHEWTHVAYTVKDTGYTTREWHIYVNGEEVPVSAVGKGITSGLSGKISIGRNFKGSIDEIAVFNRVLTPEEIKQHASLDKDNDGISDAIDNCPDAYNPEQEDFDEDGIGDVCDEDDDNDGILDVRDNCQFIVNPLQENNDNDNLGDICDVDDDNDGILDASDNCQFIANPDQLNTDADAFGDACDSDDDNDGILDASDACPFEKPEADANLDGCQDKLEDFSEIVLSLELPAGTANELTAKIDSAFVSADAGNINAAANKLNAFINSVNAQSGKKISTQDAEMLVQFADNLIVDITG